MNFVPYRKGNLYGISSRDGKIVVDPTYLSMVMAPPFFFANKDQKTTVFNRNARIIGTYSGQARAITNYFFVIAGRNREESLMDSLGNIIAANGSGILDVDYIDGFYLINEHGWNPDGKWEIVNIRGKKLNQSPIRQKPKIFHGFATYVESGKLITIDSSGNVWTSVLPEQSEFNIKNGFTVFHNKDGYGVYNQHCELVIFQQKKYIIFMQDSLENRRPYNFFNIVNYPDTTPKSKTIIKTRDYSDGTPMKEVVNNGNEPHYPDGKRGIMDTTGKIIAIPGYNITRRFFKDYYQVGEFNTNSNQWILDKNGKKVMDNSLALRYMGRNLVWAAISKNNKAVYGILNDQCEWVVPLKYEYMYSEIAIGLIIVGEGACYRSQFMNPYENSTDCKFGLINLSGLKVLSLDYDWIYNFRNRLFLVRKDGKFGLVGRNGAQLISLDNERIWNIGDKFMCVKTKGKWKIIDSSGKGIEELVYDTVTNSNKGIGLRLTKDGKNFFMTPNGKAVPENDYDQVSGYYDGVCVVYRNGKGGVLNANGELIVPIEYNIGDRFQNGIVFTNGDKGKHGIINDKGIVILPPKYNIITDYSRSPINDGLVKVRNGERGQYIDCVGINGKEYFEE